MSSNTAQPRALKLVHITTIPMSLVFLRGQVGYMKARGFEVHVISSPGSELEAFGQSENVPVTGVEMQRRITPFRDLLALTRLTRELRRIKPRIVHAHTPKGGLLGMIAASFCRTPVRIYHLRGLPLAGASGTKRLLLWCTEWLSCRLAHQVLCVSHSLRNEAAAQRVCPVTKLKVLQNGSGNGVDATNRFSPDKLDDGVRADARARFGIPVDALVIGFVGRIVRDKGIVELSEAWRGLREDYPHAHLLMIGPFELQDPIPQETEASLRWDARVHLVGLEWDIVPLYAAMDVVALPTYREGFPNVVLEAAAMRLPVVAARVAGCADAILDGQTGMLVSVRNADELRSALSRYLDDAELRRRHGAAARERVLQEYRPELIWEGLHAEYTRLLERSKRISPSTKPMELTT
jgi:glycosyltransferase involved in cell wall biosynthesis